MSLIDLIGSILSLICTYLFVKENRNAFGLSAIAIPFDAFVYYQNALYGDMFLQAIYLSMTFYGFHQWRKGDNNAGNALNISYLTTQQKIIGFALCVTGVIFINPLLKPFNHPDIALLDSITTVFSLFAQWLLCKKKIETWIVWFFVDALYAYLYVSKGLPFHGFMALIYLFMAIAGLWRWKKLLLITDINQLNKLHC